MSLNYSPQSFCPIYPCHSPDFTDGQTEASRSAVFLCQSGSHQWGCGREPFLGIPQSEFQVQEHLCLQVYHTNIIHKKHQTLHCSCCFLQISVPWRCLIQMQSQAWTTGLGSSQMWLTSLVWVVPLGFFTVVQINVCNCRIKALGCEKWRNHSLRYCICSFFVGGFILIVN